MGNNHGKEVRNLYSCHMAISPPVHTSEIMGSVSFQIGRKGREKKSIHIAWVPVSFACYTGNNWK